MRMDTLGRSRGASVYALKICQYLLGEHCIANMKSSAKNFHFKVASERYLFGTTFVYSYCK